MTSYFSCSVLNRRLQCVMLSKLTSACSLVLKFGHFELEDSTKATLLSLKIRQQPHESGLPDESQLTHMMNP